MAENSTFLSLLPTDSLATLGSQTRAGQQGVDLRELDAAVPAVYGPSVYEAFMGSRRASGPFDIEW